jgi:hypothetical protein
MIRVVETDGYASGRYGCISISEDGLLKLLVDGGIVTLRVSSEDIERVKELAINNKGSLLVHMDKERAFIIDAERGCISI